MGFFDSLFGTSTTAGQANATQHAINGLRSAKTAGNQALQQTTDQANAALNTGATNATGALTSAFGDAAGALTNYGGQALTALQGGANQAASTVQGANANLQPYASTGGAATGMLSNALGLNGTAGSTAATGAFQASPGYQWQLDQATDAAARKAASLGLAASGNTLSAITQLGSNLANTEYGNWLDRLSNASNQGLSAASGISGNDATAGGYQYGAGTGSAGILQGTGQGIGSLDSSKGLGLAGIQSNLGSSLSGNYGNLGRGISGNDTGTASEIANAQIGLGKAQDAATNANNGILSKALGTFLSPITGAASKSVGGLFSSATGGFL